MKQRHWKDSSVTQTELAELIGHSAGCIAQWTRFAGLPRKKNGRYHLKTALYWIENYYKHSAEIKISLASVSQQRLAELLGVTRQTLHDWAKQDLPRNEDGTYDVSVVLRWQVFYYKKLYASKCREICKTDEPAGTVG